MTQDQRPGSASVAQVASRAAVLRRLELAVQRKLDGNASGDHLTVGVGPGSERAGAREYEAGDDARLIDWSLTARSANTFVRTTEAEREIDTWLIADRSASLDFGTTLAEKRDVVLGAAAAFGMLCVRGHNRIGALVAGTDRLLHYPPKTGRNWLMALLAAIYQTPRQDSAPADGNDVAAAMGRLLVGQRRRSQIVVVSDFLGTDGWVKPLRALAVRHQVVAVHVTDPRELELPPVRMLALVDTETGRQRYVHTGSESLRARYAEAATERHAAIARAAASAGADYLHLSTSRDWVSDALHFATSRRGPRRGAPVERYRPNTFVVSASSVAVPSANSVNPR
jgi:uncharacterized protein (DUF58 family)